MLNSRSLQVIVFAGLALGGAPSTPSTKPASPQEAEQFEAASSILSIGLYQSASERFQHFLEEFPKSRSAPEAAYKLAVADLLGGKEQDAKQAFHSLIRYYPESPWADLASRDHCDLDELVKIADDKRSEARVPGHLQEAHAALHLYQGYATRAQETTKWSDGKRKATLFKVAECLRRSGDSDASESTLRQLIKQDANGDWAKLASIILGEGPPLESRVDEIMNLGTDGEEYPAFLEMAAARLPAVSKSDAPKLLCGMAGCLAALDRRKEAIDTCRRVVREYPSSPCAAECAFWIAEELFREGNISTARRAYLDVADKYPKSFRAAQARNWAAEVEGSDTAWADVERLLMRLVAQANQPTGGLAFRVVATSKKHGELARCRLAVQDRNHFLLSLSLGTGGFVIANNKDGGWFRALGRDEIKRSDERINPPQLKVHVYIDPVTNEPKFEFNAGPDSGAPSSIQVDPLLASCGVRALKSVWHVRKTLRKDGGKGNLTIHLECPNWGGEKADTVDLECDGSAALRAIRIRRGKDEELGLQVSDITIGRVLPEAAFCLEVPSKLRVQRVSALSSVELLGDMMKVFGEISRAVKTN